MFGTWIKLFLGHMFNLNRYNFKVKGTRKQLDSFAKTLKAEKRYMDAFKKAGLNNPRTIKNKSLMVGGGGIGGLGGEKRKCV